jgi:hypothetical protein
LAPCIRREKTITGGDYVPDCRLYQHNQKENNNKQNRFAQLLNATCHLSHFNLPLMGQSTEYTELKPLLSGVHSVMRVKSVLAGEGGGCTPTPLITFTLTSKVAVYAPAEWADTLNLFHLYQYMYSVGQSSSRVGGGGQRCGSRSDRVANVLPDSDPHFPACRSGSDLFDIKICNFFLKSFKKT